MPFFDHEPLIGPFDWSMIAPGRISADWLDSLPFFTSDGNVRVRKTSSQSQPQPSRKKFKQQKHRQNCLRKV